VRRPVPHSPEPFCRKEKDSLTRPSKHRRTILDPQDKNFPQMRVIERIVLANMTPEDTLGMYGHLPS